MIITCKQCHTKYRLAEEIFTKPDLKVRCHRCDHKFTVYRNEPEDDSFLLQDEVYADYNRIIAVGNRKGGVAKTTTCMNLGAAFAQMGKRVLLIDFDVQANLTILLGFRRAQSFYEVLHTGMRDMGEAVVHAKYPNLSLLPANSKMALLKKKYLNKRHFEYLLRDKLKSIEERYDHILIDTPPSIGFFTLNALVAANLVIIPSTCEYLAMHGINQIYDIMHVLKKEVNREVECRVLVTMYDVRNTSEKVIYEKLCQQYRESLFKTVIEKDSKIQESHIVNTPVSYYAKESRAALQYGQLAGEIAG